MNAPTVNPERNAYTANKGDDRRTFLKKATTATLGLASMDFFSSAGGNSKYAQALEDKVPWYRSASRWGQTNITEIDPSRYDIPWWRNHWKQTQVQGIIVNAGGIVAYYPSEVPLHRQARFLESRDLFGELCKAAHEEGLAVFSRMDSNRAHEKFYNVHPDWFAIDSSGDPYKAGDLFVTCINGPYYNEHIPAILSEITKKYHPEGFTDNSWSGLGRESICYCDNCKKSFGDKTGNEIPKRKNWRDKAYREWIQWNYNRRLEIWDLNNRTTKEAGGPDCIWSGMNSGSVSNQSGSFRNYKAICERADIIMLDSQARSDSGGFQQNAEMGKLIHGLLGWDKLIPESMSMYQMGRPTFRLASKPVPEARMWMIEGIAGGIQPWWHYVSAYHEDRRIYHTAESVFLWHKNKEEFLLNRTPIATIGVVWSQENHDFFGRDEADLLVEQPKRGIVQALIKARIPYIPVHADHIDRDSKNLSLLVLPNLGIISKDQVDAIKRFVEKGGGLLATGESSLYDQWGDRISDYALANIFGVHCEKIENADSDETKRNKPDRTLHTYLRLSPELRRNVDGPKTGDEPVPDGKRHDVLKGFDETDIFEFGGTLENLKVDSGTQVVLTYIPEFPIYPPETAWMREPKTDIPGLILNTLPSGARIAFMPADIDRQYARYNLPDHGKLLENIVRWASKDSVPLKVESVGLIDCNLYHQPKRLILHLVNLTSAGTWRQPVDEFIPVGPVKIEIKLSEDVQGKKLKLLVSEQEIPGEIKKGWIHFTIPSVTDHEVIVVT